VKASELIQQSCCGQIGDKALYLERVRYMEEALERLMLVDSKYVYDNCGYTIGDLKGVG